MIRTHKRADEIAKRIQQDSNFRYITLAHAACVENPNTDFSIDIFDTRSQAWANFWMDPDDLAAPLLSVVEEQFVGALAG